MDLRKIAENGMKKLLDGGANQARCTVGVTTTHEFNYMADRFTLYRVMENHSLSMASIEDGRYSVIAGNSLGDGDVAQLAEDCLKAGRSADPDPCRRFAETGEEIRHEEGPLAFDEEKLFARAKELVDTVHEKYPTINLNELIFAHNLTELVSAYNGGGRYAYRSGSYAATIMYTATSGDKASSFNYRTLLLPNLDKAFLDCDALELDLQMVSGQWDAVGLGEKFSGTVLMSPGCVEDILANVDQNFCGDMALMTKTSPWAEKLGQKVADERLDVEIAPLAPEFLGASRHTSEGRKAENFHLIRNGVLEAFDLSDFAACKTGLKASPNSEGPGYMKVRPGGKTLDEMIAAIDKGILMLRFSGGAPAANGDFSAVAKNGFLIENGKLGKALNEVMFSCNLSEMMQQVKDISCDCWGGAASQVPWISFDPIQISGAEDICEEE